MFPKRVLQQRLLSRFLSCIYIFPRVYVSHPYHLLRFSHPGIVKWKVQTVNRLITYVSQSSCYFPSVVPANLPLHFVVKHH
jgi:hypothetical protein